jgi:hypothetical protein
LRAGVVKRQVGKAAVSERTAKKEEKEEEEVE